MNEPVTKYSEITISICKQTKILAGQGKPLIDILYVNLHIIPQLRYTRICQLTYNGIFFKLNLK